MDPFDRVVQAMGAGPPVRRGDQPVVIYNTHWRNLDDGWDIASRAYARAMEMGGIDVHLKSWRYVPGPIDSDVAAEAGHLTRICLDWDVHIFSSMLTGADHMVQVLDNMLLQPGLQAMQCVFERQQIEPALVAKLNRLAGVWTQCTANYEVLQNCGVRNAKVILLPYFDDDPLLKIEPPRQNKRYYWIGRFEPRKAGDNLVKAFMTAFKPHEASLTIKLSPYGGNSTPEQAVLQILAEQAAPGWTFSNWRDSIKIIRKRLSTEEIHQLHAEHDVYVSASRGEGLDMPAFAAKLAGRRLVLTDSGGPRDFVCGTDLLVPAVRSVPADKIYEWGVGATYADYDLEDLVSALQKSASTKADGSRVPKKHRASNVAKDLRRWVDEVCQSKR